MLKRYLEDSILNDSFLDRKMAFISGPRQGGKTTITKSLLKVKNSEAFYFNFDDDDFRKLWLKSPKNFIQNLEMKNDHILALDEIHKDSRWKSKLKGLYDLYKGEINFIATGSARLDIYRKGGDSLQGRYYPYRLYPFSLGETSVIKPPPEKEWDENFKKSQFSFSDIKELSPFPDPLLRGDKRKAMRDLRLYREQIVYNDIRDLSQLKDINLIYSLALLMPERVSSQLSFESLRQDLGVSFDSVKRWIDLLQATYFCFLLRPFSHHIKNSLKKEPKLYLYDWTQVKNQGSQFENIIAFHLLKNVHAWTDLAFGNFELYYIRDKQKREVDFFVTKDNKPYLLLEVKTKSTLISSSLNYYHEVLKPKFSIQLVLDKKDEKKRNLGDKNIILMSYERFLSSIN